MIRIVFHGENAASFSDGFADLLDMPSEIAVLPDALDSPADRAAYAGAEAVIGTRYHAALPRPGALRLFQVPGAGYDAVDLAALPSCVTVKALENVADGGMRRRSAPVQAEGRVQLVTVDGDEGDYTAIRVAAGHDGQDGEQQHVGQLVDLPLRPARIRDVRQHVQQRRKHSHGNLHPRCRRKSQTLAGSGIPLAIRCLTSSRMCGRTDPVTPRQQR